MFRCGNAIAPRGCFANPPVEQRWRHWAHSLTKVYDSLAMAKLDVPWWTYDAITAVDAWLSERERPIRIYEYGSGASRDRGVAIRPRAVTMSATAPTITAPATSVRGSSGSLRTTVPRMTATTGFTYA